MSLAATALRRRWCPTLFEVGAEPSEHVGDRLAFLRGDDLLRYGLQLGPPLLGVVRSAEDALKRVECGTKSFTGFTAS
jgi:hypothetical protein